MTLPAAGRVRPTLAVPARAVKERWLYSRPAESNPDMRIDHDDPGAPAVRRRWPTVLVAAVTLAIVATLLFTGLDAQPLRGDEGLYSLVVADQLEHSLFGRLTHEGRHYLNKPPLAFLAMTASARLAGFTERALRLPSALASLVLATLLLAVGTRRAGVGAAALGVLVVFTAPRLLDAHGVRAAVTEPWLLLWTTSSLIAHSRLRRGLPGSWTLLIALTVASALTKGLVGPALVAATLVAVESIRRPAPERDAPRSARRFAPALAVLGVGAASYLAVWLWNFPSLRQLGKFLRRDWLLRATGDLQEEHLRGVGYFFERLAFDFGPWLLLAIPALLPAVWRRLRTGDDVEGIALRLFPLVTFAAFTIPRSKLVWYLYPAYPALAVVLAEGVRTLGDRLRLRPRRAWILPLLLAVPLALRLAGAHELVRQRSRADLRHLAEVVAARPAATVLADERLELDRHRPREWNRFALRYRLDARPFDPDAPLPESPCRYLVTPEPWSIAALAGIAPSRVVMMAKQPGRDPDLYVVDLCDGVFAREAASAQPPGPDAQTSAAGAGATGGTWGPIRHSGAVVALRASPSDAAAADGSS